MSIYIVLKEGGEWKLVKTGETTGAYVHTSSSDKGDVISLGNEILSNHAMEKDEFAVLIIKKASGEVQAVRSRNSDLASGWSVRVYAAPDESLPFKRFVELGIEHLSGIEEAVVGYYVARSPAEHDAIQIRNRLP